MELLLRTLTEQLLAPLHLTDFSVRATMEEGADGVVHARVYVSTPDAPLLIGRHGDILMSIQHLLKLMAGREKGEEKRFTVLLDVDGYVERKAEMSVDKARTRAASIAASGKPERLPPMNGFMRRAIHLMISEEFPTLTTESFGVGAFKSVEIRPK